MAQIEQDVGATHEEVNNTRDTLTEFQRITNERFDRVPRQEDEHKIHNKFCHPHNQNNQIVNPDERIP